MSERSEDLLKECIKEVLLLEYEGYADYGGYGGYGMENPMGLGDDVLYKIFVKPFTDVAKVTAGKTKEVSQSAQTAVKVAGETLLTTLLPGIKDKYDEIFAADRAQLEKIQNEYAEAYNATWEAFKHTDVIALAFLYRPDLFLTATLANKAPGVAAKLLSVLSGGVLDDILLRTAKREAKKKKAKGLGGKGDLYGDLVAYLEGGHTSESIIREDDGAKSELAAFMAKVVNHKKIREKLSSSALVQKMSSQGGELVRGELKKAFDQANTVLSAKSLKDISKLLGRPIKGVEGLNTLDQNTRANAEKALLTGVRTAMKDFYVKKLNTRVKAAIDAGVPNDHPFVVDHQSVINKIKSL